ncbi:protein BANP-like isoform X2 [Tachypleus tridentatus]|uniref:protein BANP-like isoform X2 n=1 Tax=Tachypleus tridentatus TaxID=6853 RepID=UPI003FD61F2D
MNSTEDNRERTSNTNEEEPLNKRKRLLAEEENQETLLKKLLVTFHHTVSQRLDSIENRLECVTTSCKALEEKLEVLEAAWKESSSTQHFISTAGETMNYCKFCYCEGSPGSVSSEESEHCAVSLGSSVTFITLNSEVDFPNGSWLGDENNVELRVRCHITPSELFHINNTCTTPEKMALTLLDYLFDRETQACSNISGTGKHRKRQLDPLMVYGIRCHLIYKFGISPVDWMRIKQNLDSKCRTAFRRKQKGLPLTRKGCPLDMTEVEDNSTHLVTYPLSGGVVKEVMSSDGEISESSGFELICYQTDLDTTNFNLQTNEGTGVEDSQAAGTHSGLKPQRKKNSHCACHS